MVSRQLLSGVLPALPARSPLGTEPPVASPCPRPGPGPPTAAPPRVTGGPVSAVSPPRSAVLECSHVCGIDSTVVLGLEELLQDFHRRGVTLALVGLQVGGVRGAGRASVPPHACP